ncbi:MAG: spermidine synthase [Pirellulales bacterium]
MKSARWWILAIGLAFGAIALVGREREAPPSAETPTVRLAAMFDAFGGEEVLYEKESLYHYIRVVESGGVRRLQFRRAGGDHEESAIDLAKPLEFQMEYYRLMMAVLAHQPSPKSVLVVGLGGGALPMALHRYYPAARIDCVELDPDVAEVAKRYFGFREDERLKVYVGDGRVQVRRFARDPRKYDVVMLDAFRGGYIPYHLTTREFLEQVKAILTDRGVVVANLLPGFESYHYQRRTMAAAFRQQWSYGSGGNIAVVAGDARSAPTQDQLIATARRLQKEKALSLPLLSIVEEGGVRDDYVKQGPILTDDYAPTDLLRSMPRE